jgi:hypothetical protein
MLFSLIAGSLLLAGCASDGTEPSTNSTTPANPYPGPYTQNPFYPQDGPTR